LLKITAMIGTLSKLTRIKSSFKLIIRESKLETNKYVITLKLRYLICTMNTERHQNTWILIG